MNSLFYLANSIAADEQVSLRTRGLIQYKDDILPV